MFEKWESRLSMAEDEVYLALILKTDNIKIKEKKEEVKMRIKTSKLLRVILLCIVGAVFLGAGSVEAFDIDGDFTVSGNLGIGTESPSQKLTIYDGELSLQAIDNSQDQGILFQNSGGWYTWRIYRTDAGSSYADLRFASGKGPDYTALTDRVTIDKDGKVGIGTMSPATELDVNGTITTPGGNSSNWNTAYSWGDHASANYLTIESDPIFTAWDKSTDISITESQVTDLSHFTTNDETDPNVNALGKASLNCISGEIAKFDGSNWTCAATNLSGNVTAVTYVVAASDSVNPRADYICTGTDDNVCIQNAIDAITGVGGKIALLDGTYNISSPINILRDDITLVGAGRSATRLIAQSAITVINITGDQVKLADFGIEGGGQADYGVITQGWYTTVTHVRMQGFIKGAIKFDGPTDIGYDDKLLGGIVENSYFIGTEEYADDSGVEIYGASGRITIKNNTFENFGNAIYAHEVGVQGENIFIDGNTFRYSRLHFCENGKEDITKRIGISITNNRIYDGTLLFDAEVDGATEWGAIIANNKITRLSNKADTVINLEYGSAMIVGNIIQLGGVTEPVEEEGTALLLGKEGSTIIGNTFNSGETRIKLLGDVSNITISGNIFLYMGYCITDIEGNIIQCNDTTGIHLKEKLRVRDSKIVGPYDISTTGNIFSIGAVAGHYTGIKVDPSSNWNTITGNLFDGAQAATPIDLQGTDTTIKDNKGFLTENSGEETISSTATFVTVSHGLDITPLIKDITVVATNNMGNAYKFWVSNVTADTFDINVDVDPGTGGAEFSWQIGGY